MNLVFHKNINLFQSSIQKYALSFQIAYIQNCNCINCIAIITCYVHFRLAHLSCFNNNYEM